VIEYLLLILLLAVCVLFVLMPFYIALPWGAGWNALVMGSVATGIIVGFFIVKFKGGSN
jgi:hypothetical protein